MERKYLALNTAIFFWLLGLIAWLCNQISLASLSGALAFITFIIHTQKHKMQTMFIKKNKTAVKESTVIPPPQPISEPEATTAKKQDMTVIANGVHVEGNIAACGHVYIHGKLSGNIEAKDKIIKVMRNGEVEGNIVCRELIVDGSVQGQCTCDTIEIYEHGSITGTLAYRTLAIKKGGTLSGQAEMLAPEAEKSNIIGLVTETLPITGDLTKSQSA